MVAICLMRYANLCESDLVGHFVNHFQKRFTEVDAVRIIKGK